jgi:hypothetical protein
MQHYTRPTQFERCKRKASQLRWLTPFGSAAVFIGCANSQNFTQRIRQVIEVESPH